MLRQILAIALPLVAPTLVYIVWLRLRGARHGWRAWPWARLILAGAVLVAVTLSLTAITGRTPRGTDYAPPRLEDGRIVPGQILPPPDDAAR